MEPREAALLSSILHLPAGIAILSVHPSATDRVVRVECHAPSMPGEDVPAALASHPRELSTNGCRFALCGPQCALNAHGAQICV
jgi:hypothetical protein